jgi:hypothetical protein
MSVGIDAAWFPFMYGALAALGLTASLFFVRYYKSARDRFFVFFAIAFALLGVNWALLVGRDPRDEYAPYVYLLRLTAFLLIVVAIVDKNRQSREHD